MDNDQPVYENLIQTDTIMYERHGIGEIKTTNLDEDDIILHEDHIYYAHVSYSSKSKLKIRSVFFFKLANKYCINSRSSTSPSNLNTFDIRSNIE